MELSDEELMNIVTSMETPHTPPLFDDGGLDDMELMSAVINIESPSSPSSSPLLTENDELSDSIETAVITGEIGQLSWQDVFDFFNEPILISDSEEEDNVDAVSISSDSDSDIIMPCVGAQAPRCWDLGLENRSPKSKFTSTPLLIKCMFD